MNFVLKHFVIGWCTGLLLGLFLTTCDHRPDDISDPINNTPNTGTGDTGNNGNNDHPTGDDESIYTKATLEDFLGTFSVSATKCYYKTTETYTSKIYRTSSRRNNGYVWLKIEGLYEGNEFLNAYGYFDTNRGCVRIPANVPELSEFFIFTNEPDTSYYAVFIPCYSIDNGESFYTLEDDTDEMWLRKNKSGQLVLCASEFPSAEYGHYANAFTFYYYYTDFEKKPDSNHFSTYGNVIMKRTTAMSVPPLSPDKPNVLPQCKKQ